MKKKIKIISIFIILILTLGVKNISYAAEDQGVEGSRGSTKTEQSESSSSWGSIFDKADEFVNKGKPTKSEKTDDDTINIDEGKLKKNLAQIFNILSTIGVILSVVVGGILGIKFMMASAEDKAQIKEMMVPYIVGCAVIFGAFAIWKFVVSMLAAV